MTRLRGKLTYANVVATLALFLVLAGGSAFAAKQLLPKNSVGTKQVKNNAITGAKIKNGAVTGAKIAPGAIGTVGSATNAAHAATADSATEAAHAQSADSATEAGALGGIAAAGYQRRTMWAFVDSGGQIASQSSGISVQAHVKGGTWLHFPEQVGGKGLLATAWAGDQVFEDSIEAASCGYVSEAATPGSIACDHGTNTLDDAFVGTDTERMGNSLGFYVVVVP